MSNIQNLEIELYHDQIAKDLHQVIQKYRGIMIRDVPANDPLKADTLIFQAFHTVLTELEKDQ